MGPAIGPGFSGTTRNAVLRPVHSPLACARERRASFHVSLVSAPVKRYMARPEGFEPPTPWFVARYSIQLSYGRVRPDLFPRAASLASREDAGL